MSARGPLLAFAAFGAFWGAWAAVLPGVRTETGASAAELGAALLFVAVGALPAMLLTGIAVDRLGPLVAPALVAFAVAVVLPGLAESPVALGLALTVVGAASGALDVAANAAVASLEAASGRRLMQLAHALFSAGLVVGSVTAGLAREAGASPRQALIAVAAVLALTATANLRAPRRPGERRAARLVLSADLVLLGLLCAVAFVVESGVESWSALFLETELGASPATSGLGPGAFAAAMAVGRLLGQGLGARIGDRRLLSAGALVAGIGTLGAAAAPGAPLALVAFAVAGAGISVAAPVLFGAGGRARDEAARGGAVATVTTISYLGFLAGPPLMGGVTGTLGFRAAWGLLALLAAGVAVAALRFRALERQ